MHTERGKGSNWNSAKMKIVTCFPKLFKKAQVVKHSNSSRRVVFEFGDFIKQFTLQ